MTELSEDLDRHWSSDELSSLSERDLTALQFRRDLKNAAFFFAQSLLFYIAVEALGVVGWVLGWIAVAQFGFFALYNVVAFVLRGIATLVRPNGWKIIQLSVLIANMAYYGILASVFWQKLT